MPRYSGRWTPNGLCSLFICDVASFGDRSRTDLERRKIRTALYDRLYRSFGDVGIMLGACYREDRGDGVLIVVPPYVDTAILLTSLAHRLRAEVRQHNDVSTEAARMRLRLAVHTGIVHSDDEGLVGTAVIHAFRMLEAPQLKQVLRATGADVALIASDRVYDDVIRHGPGLVDPAEFHQVELHVKEERAAVAWITLPGMSVPIRHVPSAPPTVPTVPELSPLAVTIIDEPPGLDDVVDRALDIRQLRSRRIRDRILAELPLALAARIEPRRSGDGRADVTAIVRACEQHPKGLSDFLHVVRQFVGDSTQMDDLRQAIDELGRRTMPVRVYLSTDHDHQAVENALEELLEVYGLEIIQRSSEVYGSWFREFFARAKDGAPTIEESTTKIARGIELQALHRPQADVDARQADAVAKLMTALEKEENAAIQIGSILLVKVNNSYVVRTLTQLQLAHLERNPELFQDPTTVLRQLQQAVPDDGTPVTPGKGLCPCGSGMKVVFCHHDKEFGIGL